MCFLGSSMFSLGSAKVVPILFVIFMDRTSRGSWGMENVQFGDFRIGSLLCVSGS